MTTEQSHSEHVKDIEKLERIVKAVYDDTELARSKFGEFKATLDQYQEQPQLLDPHLEGLVTPLAARLSGVAESLQDDGLFAAAMQICRLLQALVTVRGFKTVSRFLPHKPTDIERAVQVLKHVQHAVKSHEIDEDAQDGGWQMRCIVLLWLSNLVLIPFDISTVYISSDGAHASSGLDAPSSAVRWLIDLARLYLCDPGSTRYVARC
jgi:tubulin-specific chaperone D